MLEKAEATSLTTLMSPFRGRKRQYLLLRIAGLDESNSKSELEIATRTLQNWKTEDAFARVEDYLFEWRNRYQVEALELLRQDNRAIGVLIERRTLLRIVDELEEGEYVLLKTRFGRDVYKNLMTAVNNTSNPAQSWQQLIAGVVNVQTGDNSQAAVSQTPQRIEGNDDESHPQQSFDCEAEVLPEGDADDEGT